MIKWRRSPATIVRDVREDTSALISDGLNAHQRGDLSTARATYERILTIDPTHADARYLLGVLDLAAGDTHGALTAIDAAIAAAPDRAPYHYSRAEALRANGRFDDAIAAFRCALALDDSDADWWNELALSLQAVGKTGEAKAAYAEALDREQDHVVALCNLGNLSTHANDPAVAIPMLRRAIELRADAPVAHLSLGLALVAAGRSADAVECFTSAEALVRRIPGSAESLIDQGILFERLGWRAAAEHCYRMATSGHPELLAGWINLSTLFLRGGRVPQALEAAQKAVQLAPDTPVAKRQFALALAASGDLAGAEDEAHRAAALAPADADSHYVLGTILSQRGFLEEAEAAYRHSISKRPGFLDAEMGLANVLQHAGRYADAVAVLQQVLTVHPTSAEALLNLGVALAEIHRVDEAERCLQKALELKPSLAEANVSLTNLYFSQSRLDEGEAAARAALALQPDNPVAWMNLGTILQQQGRVAEAVEASRKVIALTPQDSFAWSNLLLTLNYLPGPTPAELLEEHRAFGRRFDPPPEQVPSFAGRRLRSGRKLRVGYLSPDFRDHVVTFFFEPVLAHHDRRNFEIMCYYNHTTVDASTRRLRDRADLWRDVAALSDENLVELMREDDLDIAVDLAGHTARSRITVFARRVAPVQITWLGYPNTTGLAQMDWRITDSRADPPGYEDHHTERLLRMPGVFLPFAPPEDAPEVGPPPCFAAGRVTFGVFNNYPKITDPMLKLWGDILASLPDARLLMKTASLRDPGVLRSTHERLRLAGIDSSRVDLVGFVPGRREHLAAIGRVDIALDTFPYHGTTTTCESLWMGVPVVSLAGQRHAARVGVSLLEYLGLHELVTSSEQAYHDIAVELGRDPQRLRRLRFELRERMHESGLTDVARFTRQLEDAYRNTGRIREGIV